MKLIRKPLLILSIVLTLLIPLGTMASADPGNGNGRGRPTLVETSTAVDPGDGGIGY